MFEEQMEQDLGFSESATYRTKEVMSHVAHNTKKQESNVRC